MLGRAAIALWYDVPPEARAEWEDWHTHEHMPERLAIPGFLRGTRWVSGNDFFGLYEANSLATLTTGAYMQSLNNPTPWSRQMMPHHHHMVRSVCRVRATAGAGLSGFVATLRFSPPQRRRGALLKQLAVETVPKLPGRRGLAGAHLLQSQPKQETTEERIRGGDASADCVLLVHGYDADVVQALESELAPQLPGALCSFYRLAFALTPRG